MRLRKQIFTKSDCYNKSHSCKHIGVMIHSTGACNPRVSRYVPGDPEIGYNLMHNHGDRPGIEKGVHAFIGKFADGGIGTVQTLPWNWRAWHCGRGKKGSANDTHIGVEICEDALVDQKYFNAVYQEAVELTAYLCKEFGFDPMKPGVILSHYEGYKNGVASAHVDVSHWFPKHGKTMNMFRADVARQMEEDDMSYEQFKEYLDRYMKERADMPASGWAKTPLTEAKKRGITDGSRPRSYATREEVAAMVNAATK